MDSTPNQRVALWTSASLLSLLFFLSFGCYKYTLNNNPDTQTNEPDTQTDEPDTQTDDSDWQTGDSDPNTVNPDSETNELDTNASCPAAGYKGANCDELCASVKLAVLQCANTEVECDSLLSADSTTSTTRQCFSGQDACFPLDFDFTLADRFYVNGFRFRADWHDKRPKIWDLFASDDGIHYTVVLTAQSNVSPWKCVQDAPCTQAVPEECCPGGATQDISSVGDFYSKWDDFRFTGAVAKYWRFRIRSLSYPGYLDLHKVEFYGNRCLGNLCSQTSCDTGICTGDRPASCACADCQPTASCTSAFVDTEGGCV